MKVCFSVLKPIRINGLIVILESPRIVSIHLKQQDDYCSCLPEHFTTMQPISSDLSLFLDTE